MCVRACACACVRFLACVCMCARARLCACAQTPDGSTYNSTDFSDGNFRLLLDNPVRGGNYTCRIPSHLLAAACLQGNDAHEGEATLIVDELDARLTLLEQENEQLKHEYSVLTNSTDDMFSQLEDEDQQLRNEDQQLAQRIDWIDSRSLVSFI